MSDTSQAPVYFVAYASNATKHFTSADLVALLTQSRSNNGPAGVTGLLLHRGGNFLQALEGPEAAVRETMARIARDPRHRSVVDLYEGFHDERLFGAWEMGFEEVSRLDAAAHPGVSTFLTREDDSQTTELLAHDVYEFFRAFREHMR